MSRVDTVCLSHDAGVARIRLLRPEKRNALTQAMWAELERQLHEVAQSSSHVLVLSGSSGAFSAGADIDELRSQLQDPAGMAAGSDQVQRTQLALQRLPQTTLAVIDGACVGGGLGLALACDLRIASVRSRFAITPARLGLVYSPADTRRLVSTVGLSMARRLLLCAEMLDASQALQCGLVDACHEPAALDAATAELLAMLEATSPQARVGLKQVLAHVAGDPTMDADAAMQVFLDSFASADFAEGASAFLDKRAPRFARLRASPDDDGT